MMKIYTIWKSKKDISMYNSIEQYITQIWRILYKEYCGLFQQGIKVKGWWFRARAKQLIKNSTCKSYSTFQTCGLMDLKRHFKVSLHHLTNKPQYIIVDKRN